MGVGTAPQRGQGREHRAHALLHGAVEPAMTAATASPDVPAAVKALTDQAAIAKLLAETVIQEQARPAQLVHAAYACAALARLPPCALPAC